MSSDRSRPRRAVPVHAGVLVIPGALGLLTALTVLLTLRTPGLAVVSGLGVLVASLACTLLLQALFGGADRPDRR